MGNQCCSASGEPTEPLAQYFGTPISTLCVYEAQLLGLAQPLSGDAFHVSQVASSDAAPSASHRRPLSEGNGAARRSRTVRHEVPILVESVCGLLVELCPRAGGQAHAPIFEPPTVQRLVTSAQPWVNQIRSAVHHTFVTDKERWREYKSVVQRWLKREPADLAARQEGLPTALLVDPISTVLRRWEPSSSRCLALLAHFMHNLPSPLLPEVTAIELQHALRRKGDSSSAAFLGVFHSTFASTFPVEYATWGRIATCFAKLAGTTSAFTARSSPASTATSRLDTERALKWRSVVETCLREGGVFRDPATHRDVETAVLDYIFGYPPPPPLASAVQPAATSAVSPLPVLSDGGSNSEATTLSKGAAMSAAVSTTGATGGTLNFTAGAGEVRRDQLTVDNSTGRVGGHSGPTTSAVAGSLVHSASFCSTDDDTATRGDQHDSAPASGPTVRHVADAAAPAVGPAIPLSKSEVVLQQSNVDAEAPPQRSRQPSVVLSAASGTPRQDDLPLPQSKYRDSPAPVPHSSDASGSEQAAPQRSRIEGGNMKRLLDLKAQLCSGVDGVVIQPMGVAAEGAAEEATRNEGAANIGVVHSTQQHNGATLHFPEMSQESHNALLATIQSFMRESTEVAASLREELASLRQQVKRTASLVEDGVVHRPFRTQTQHSLGELAHSVADTNEELVKIKQHLKHLEEGLTHSTIDRDRLSADAAAARFSAQEVLLKWADMERALLHHDQALKFLERKLEDTDAKQRKFDAHEKSLRVDMDTLQRRLLTSLRTVV